MREEISHVVVAAVSFKNSELSMRMTLQLTIETNKNLNAKHVINAKNILEAHAIPVYLDV